jgi:hypothetical protein
MDLTRVKNTRNNFVIVGSGYNPFQIYAQRFKVNNNYDATCVYIYRVAKLIGKSDSYRYVVDVRVVVIVWYRLLHLDLLIQERTRRKKYSL